MGGQSQNGTYSYYESESACFVLCSVTALYTPVLKLCIARSKHDGTRAETRFGLSAKGHVHLNRRRCQFSRLLAAEECASGVVMLDRPCSYTVQEGWLPTPFASFPFTSPTPASPFAIRFRTRYNKNYLCHLAMFT